MTPVSVTLSMILALAAQNPDDRPPRADEDNGYRTLVIQNGGHRTVHYFSDSLGEQASLKDRERAENEAAYLDQLQRLRMQYLTNEVALEAKRRAVQEAFYGYSNVQTTKSTNTAMANNPYSSSFLVNPVTSPYSIQGIGSVAPSLSGAGNNNNGQGGANQPAANQNRNNTVPSSPVAFPFSSGFAGGPSMSPFGNTTVPFGGFGGGGLYPWGGFGGGAYPLGSPFGSQAAVSNVENSNVAVQTAPPDDGGPFKGELSKAIALHATPQYAAYVREAVASARDRKPTVAVTFKDGEKREGKLVRETDDWIVIDTGAEQVTARKADVSRISRTGGVVPAEHRQRQPNQPR